MSEEGKAFGLFELLNVAGETSLGQIYQARQRDGQRVSLFQLDRRLSGDKQYMERFSNRAHAAAQIQHPNLSSVIDVGKVDGVDFLACEWVEGRSARELLAANGSFTEQEALRIVCSCAEALKAAWDAKQLTHDGIRLEEIMVGPGGQVKLTGLALARPDEGSRIGDLRALAGAFYQMLVNQPAPLSGRFPDLSKKRPELNPGIGEILDKMMMEPAWNYASYDQLIEDVAALMKGGRPKNTEVKLSLGGSLNQKSEVEVQQHQQQQKAISGFYLKQKRRQIGKQVLSWSVALAVFAGACFWFWNYFQQAQPLPAAKSSPTELVTASSPVLVPATAAPVVVPVATASKPAMPTFEEIADLDERGRAMAKYLGAGRLQKKFAAPLDLMEDGEVKWSYGFQKGNGLQDFSGGQHQIQDGLFQLPKGQKAFKCPLRGDLKLIVDGTFVGADPETEIQALGVVWNQNGDSQREFSFTRTEAVLSERVNGKRVVVASAAFKLRPGTPVRYMITQHASACTVTVRSGPVLIGSFSQQLEGVLQLVSNGCTSAYSALEITGTASAAWLYSAAN